MSTTLPRVTCPSCAGDFPAPTEMAGESGRREMHDGDVTTCPWCVCLLWVREGKFVLMKDEEVQEAMAPFSPRDIVLLVQHMAAQKRARNERLARGEPR